MRKSVKLAVAAAMAAVMMAGCSSGNSTGNVAADKKRVRLIRLWMQGQIRMLPGRMLRMRVTLSASASLQSMALWTTAGRDF